MPSSRAPAVHGRDRSIIATIAPVVAPVVATVVAVVAISAKGHDSHNSDAEAIAYDDRFDRRLSTYCTDGLTALSVR
jgi:hypothetical protein